jgi:hypothetical protein
MSRIRSREAHQSAQVGLIDRTKDHECEGDYYVQPAHGSSPPYLVGRFASGYDHLPIVDGKRQCREALPDLPLDEAIDYAMSYELGIKGRPWLLN